MSSIIVAVMAVSAIVIIALTLITSLSRAKSATRWLKGYNLKSNMSEEAVLELLKRVPYPQKESVVMDADGKISFKTKIYEYPVELSKDENGNTTVGLIVNWLKVSKSKKKKVAFDFDNVYQFLKQEVEGIGSVDAMETYERNLKRQKAVTIAGIIFVVSSICFMLFG